MNKITWGFILLLVLTGCNSPVIVVKPNDVEYAPIIPRAPMPSKINNGGIYQAGFEYSLFSDRRSNRVGDIITVMLTEQTVSSKSAETSVKKNQKIDFNEPSVLGTALSFKNLSMLTGIDQSRDFSGAAESDQSNSLQGSIAVTVSEVLSNGNLRVRGEKWMTLNRGEEYIRIKGLIRPEDIGSDNTIDSTKLADARITYSGTGELASSNKNGWLGRFFNSAYWPF